jgi:hypothetical protein
MKDELGGIMAREFVDTKSKMYALDKTKKIKGIKTSVVKMKFQWTTTKNF